MDTAQQFSKRAVAFLDAGISEHEEALRKLRGARSALIEGPAKPKRRRRRRKGIQHARTTPVANEREQEHGHREGMVIGSLKVQGAATLAQLAEHTGLAPDDVQDALSRLFEADEVEAAEGIWQLTERGEIAHAS